jgi:hypothetical protein
MKTIDWKDVTIRAIKTFMEAFFAFAGAELAGMDLFSIGKDMWCAVGISAAAAGISAVWNGMIEPALNALTKKE